MNKNKRHYIAWDYKSDQLDIAEMLIAEINDLLSDNKIKIHYKYVNSQIFDYKINLSKSFPNPK
tara:strand:+ start:135 stop:326 length:192 start_codon:yes stop_codon:yes gene_type:complete